MHPAREAHRLAGMRVPQLATRVAPIRRREHPGSAIAPAR
jgi:hypothetical protein